MMPAATGLADDYTDVCCTSSSRNLPQYSLLVLVRVRQKSTETREEKEKKKTGAKYSKIVEKQKTQIQSQLM
jgi:hypothetical protein